MAQCHVHLPGLGGPMAAELDRLSASDAPSALAELLRGARGEACQISDWSTRLAQQLGAEQAPVALAGWRADFGQLPKQACLRADPVHLRVDRDCARVFDARLLNLQEIEARALCDSLAEHLSDSGLSLQMADVARWYLIGEPLSGLHTTPLPQAIGRSAGPELPRGEFARDWARLHTELQMLLHQHPVNETREQAGLPAINSLWLWGEGELPVMPADLDIHASVPWVRGLSSQPQSSFAEALAANGDCLLIDDRLLRALETGDPESWHRGEQVLETELFVPLLERWQSGVITKLSIDIGTAVLDADRRWWRRLRSPSLGALLGGFQ